MTIRYNQDRKKNGLVLLVLLMYSDYITPIVMNISFGTIFGSQQFTQTRHKQNSPILNSSPLFDQKVSKEPP